MAKTKGMRCRFNSSKQEKSFLTLRAGTMIRPSTRLSNESRMIFSSRVRSLFEIERIRL